eukprot:6692273-Prymnesium_polylepis.1
MPSDVAHVDRRQLNVTLLCANGFARADRGQGRPRVERVPYFPQQAAQALAKFSCVAFLDAIEPVAQFGYDDGLSLLVAKTTKTFAISAKARAPAP